MKVITFTFWPHFPWERNTKHKIGGWMGTRAGLEVGWSSNYAVRKAMRISEV